MDPEELERWLDRQFPQGRPAWAQHIDWEKYTPPSPEGSLSAFDGRLVLDLDTRVVTVDGREVQLTHASTRLLRTLIELGEGAHDPLVITERVWDSAWLDERELRYPIALLRHLLGHQQWIEWTADGVVLHPPETGPPVAY
ncbi:hypothetical protein [Streptomyces sp. FH025]|uniref:hypothetical protein n=1 Tax=Streptomyces sp. FH025 TaxID=2815937 RepID=UPI001A9E4B57|nr:hypothetical protein [Streptomyces sp. FH025]MBO1419130.1 hypothetical protein [Streptomyces sp. FH025]